VSEILPIYECFPAGIQDATSKEQIELRDKLIADLKELVRSAWPVLVAGDDDAQMDAWLERRNELLGEEKVCCIESLVSCS
jgi:hypothetical protein